MATSRSIVLCTVGTSLFYPNLSRLRQTLQEEDKLPEERRTIPASLRPVAEELEAAYQAKDWRRVAANLLQFPSHHRLCGAEINSLASLIDHGYIRPDAGIFFLHSDTDDGRATATILTEYYRQRGHAPVEGLQVDELQDSDPRRFRTKGLRNLARRLAATVRDHSAAACAINATGGYKAQIPVAVLMGQSMGVPVYYMHERFSEIIAFPPLPVAFDFEKWMEWSGLLYVLEKELQLSKAQIEEDWEWDETLESLVEVVDIDGEKWVELSPTGQIFHETFRERFRSLRDVVLPPPLVGKPEPPKLRDHSVTTKLRDELLRYLSEVTAALNCIRRCETYYCHPNLNAPMCFRLKKGKVEGVYSNGKETVKFFVETTATTEGQKRAVIATLNQWLQERKS